MKVPLGAILADFTTALFLVAPVVHGLALWGAVPLLNLGLPGWYSLAVYGLAAPYVGVLLWRRHRRARFVFYVFLSLEVVRAMQQNRYPALTVALSLLLLFQLPTVRRIYPMLDAQSIRQRLQSKRV